MAWNLSVITQTEISYIYEEDCLIDLFIAKLWHHYYRDNCTHSPGINVPIIEHLVFNYIIDGQA